MAQLRADGSIQALIAAGCLAQRYQDEIQKEIPEVDAIHPNETNKIFINFDLSLLLWYNLNLAFI